MAAFSSERLFLVLIFWRPIDGVDFPDQRKSKSCFFLVLFLVTRRPTSNNSNPKQFTEEYSFRNANKLLLYKKPNVNSFLLSRKDF